MRAPVLAAAPTAYADPTTGIRGGQVRANRVASDTGDRHQQVWAKVRKVQDGLSANLGVPVNAAASQSSLQLALENEKLKDAQAAYLTALQRAGEKDSDVVGYIFAVNGKLNSAEVYPSNGLFRKMWPKLLQASVTEAIGHKNADSDPTPSSDVALAFLDEAAKGKASEKPLPAAVQLEMRDGDTALYFETRRASGAWVHRSYLAK
jgi:hypothetical protein